VDDLESSVLSAWYCGRPEIRQLLAIRDAEGLRVLVHVEPAQDSGEISPAWPANRDVWLDELQWHTGSTVRLELANESLADDADDDGARGVVVASLSWRDPSHI
jgi:hypothetical protein